MDAKHLNVSEGSGLGAPKTMRRSKRQASYTRQCQDNVKHNEHNVRAVWFRAPIKPSVHDREQELLFS